MPIKLTNAKELLGFQAEFNFFLNSMKKERNKRSIR